MNPVYNAEADFFFFQRAKPPRLSPLSARDLPPPTRISDSAGPARRPSSSTPHSLQLPTPKPASPSFLWLNAAREASCIASNALKLGVYQGDGGSKGTEEKNGE